MSCTPSIFPVTTMPCKTSLMDTKRKNEAIYIYNWSLDKAIKAKKILWMQRTCFWEPYAAFGASELNLRRNDVQWDRRAILPEKKGGCSSFCAVPSKNELCWVHRGFLKCEILRVQLCWWVLYCFVGNVYFLCWITFFPLSVKNGKKCNTVIATILKFFPHSKWSTKRWTGQSKCSVRSYIHQPYLKPRIYRVSSVPPELIISIRGKENKGN